MVACYNTVLVTINGEVGEIQRLVASCCVCRRLRLWSSDCSPTHCMKRHKQKSCMSCASEKWGYVHVCIQACIPTSSLYLDLCLICYISVCVCVCMSGCVHVCRQYICRTIYVLFSQLVAEIKEAKKELKKAQTIMQMEELKCRKRVLRRLVLIQTDEWNIVLAVIVMFILFVTLFPLPTIFSNA